MTFTFLTAVSLVLSLPMFAEQFYVTNISEQQQETQTPAPAQSNPPVASTPAPDEKEKPAEEKRIKPHYIGVRRPEPRAKRKSSKIKNQWFSSKTHPKTAKKEAPHEEEPEITSAELAEDRPFYVRTVQSSAPTHNSSIKSSPWMSSPQQQQQQEPASEGHTYPQAGFQAPKSDVYFTAEYLLWRTRQEGMEFATSKSVRFGFDSGFRFGFGVHLPYDGWDTYVNYTWFSPVHSQNKHGSFYPLFLFEGAGSQGSSVAEAHARWKLELNVLDVEIGRVYHLSKTLIFRPFVGIKGAWIDQHAHIHYAGGFIPAGQTFRTHFENDFKGAGPLLGIESNWEMGAGLSLFGDLSTAIIVGHFDNEQEQLQLDNAEVVDLNSAFNLVSPFLQMIAGLAWDLNFSKDRYHVGLRAGFETQFWWDQNQIEQFTDKDFPIYVRKQGDLAFYGLTLRARFDF